MTCPKVGSYLSPRHKQQHDALTIGHNRMYTSVKPMPTIAFGDDCHVCNTAQYGCARAQVRAPAPFKPKTQERNGHIYSIWLTGLHRFQDVHWIWKIFLNSVCHFPCQSWQKHSKQTATCSWRISTESDMSTPYEKVEVQCDNKPLSASVNFTSQQDVTAPGLRRITHGEQESHQMAYHFYPTCHFTAFRQHCRVKQLNFTVILSGLLLRKRRWLITNGQTYSGNKALKRSFMSHELHSDVQALWNDQSNKPPVGEVQPLTLCSSVVYKLIINVVGANLQSTALSYTGHFAASLKMCCRTSLKQCFKKYREKNHQKPTNVAVASQSVWWSWNLSQDVRLSWIS